MSPEPDPSLESEQSTESEQLLESGRSEESKEPLMSTHTETTSHSHKPVTLAAEKSHLLEARRIVTVNSRWAAGLGLIPVPLADWAAITAIQLRMLHDLCREYHVPYDKARASRFVGAIVGGLIPTSVGYSLASFLKAIPILGTAAVVAVPVMAYASTYALGEVFVPHFESGGNLYTFDPDSQAALFAFYYNKGKLAADAGL
jgi:uncharacterized protein (DUF697 family)